MSCTNRTQLTNVQDATPTTGGEVIQMAGRFLKRRRVPEQQQRATVQPSEQTPQQQLAITVEAMFLASGRTLTDPATAEALTVTLDAVLLMLEGTLSQDNITVGQYTDLRAMIEGIQDSPRHV